MPVTLDRSSAVIYPFVVFHISLGSTLYAHSPNTKAIVQLETFPLEIVLNDFIKIDRLEKI